MLKQFERLNRPLKVFYSYSKYDLEMLESLIKHFSQLRNDGTIMDWYDYHIRPGSEWSPSIHTELNEADIIILCISANFLSTPYCYQTELTIAMERHHKGEALVIPIFFKACDWSSAPFKILQGLPRKARPIDSFTNQNEVLTTITKELRQLIKQWHAPAQPLSHLEQQNRERFLKQMRKTWIEAVLHHSLDHDVLLTMGLQDQPDALYNPWRLEVQETDQPAHQWPEGTSIIHIFDQCEGDLLILGEPGSGKTTLLLQLAEELVQRAEKDHKQPIPTIFNLSSWAQKKLPLEEWMLAELSSKYHVPQRIGQDWLNKHQLLPLLDGLDEVASTARQDCLTAINAFYQAQREQGFTPHLVICCRSQEYAQLSVQLQGRQAINILPLTDQQVANYLQQVHPQSESLLLLLQADAELYKQAHYPLMLTIFCVAYADRTEAQPNSITLDTIFERYVEKMFSRRKAPRAGTKAEMLRWLGFLAHQLKRSDQTIFTIEEIQPDWLTDRSRRLYRWSFFLIIDLIFGLLTALLFSMLEGPLIGVAVGLVVGTLAGPLFNPSEKIKTVEIFHWSAKKYITSFLLGLLGGEILGLTFGLLVGLATNLFTSLWVGLISGSLIGLLAGLLISLFIGITPEQIPKNEKYIPNEGITKSLKYGLITIGILTSLIGLFFTLFSALFKHLLGNQLINPLEGWIGGLLVGLLFSLLFSLEFGLRACLQHFVLRFWMQRTQILPWKLQPFLEESSERLLLHRLGGSYIFTHRLLLEHFTERSLPLDKL